LGPKNKDEESDARTFAPQSHYLPQNHRLFTPNAEINTGKYTTNTGKYWINRGKHNDEVGE